MARPHPPSPRAGRSPPPDLVGTALQTRSRGLSRRDLSTPLRTADRSPSGFISLPPEARASTYRLLARLTLAEVDVALADSLRQLPIFGQALPPAGDDEGLQALRAEYTRTFLMNVHPFESVYLDEAGMLNTSQSSSVLAHYAEHGFEPPAGRSTGAPDHLGLELQFMAHLVDREVAARRAGRAAIAQALRADQVHFLEGHLLKWAPIFGAVLTEMATGALYNALGEVLQAFLLGDHGALVVESPGGTAA